VSFEAIRRALQQRGLPPTAKFVLIALADCVNSQSSKSTGELVCHPSVSALVELTGLGRRTVFDNLKVLEQIGRIERLPGHRGRATTYRLLLDECEYRTNHEQASVQEPHHPVREPHSTSAGAALPSAGTAPQPGRNQEKNQEGTKKHRERAQASETKQEEFQLEALAKKPKKQTEPAMQLPDCIPAGSWEDYLEHRKAMKAPMTAVAQRRAIVLLERMEAEGQSSEAVLEQSIVNGWKGLFPVNGSRSDKSDRLTARAETIANANKTEAEEFLSNHRVPIEGEFEHVYESRTAVG